MKAVLVVYLTLQGYTVTVESRRQPNLAACKVVLESMLATVRASGLPHRTVKERCQRRK